MTNGLRSVAANYIIILSNGIGKLIRNDDNINNIIPTTYIWSNGVREPTLGRVQDPRKTIYNDDHDDN